MNCTKMDWKDVNKDIQKISDNEELEIEKDIDEHWEEFI